METTVSLVQMLDARERRVRHQQELLAQYRKPLICFTMNICGPVKDSPLIRRGFGRGRQLLRQQFLRAKLTPLYQDAVREVTGCEAFYVLDADPLTIKKFTTDIEDATPLGRLFDMDVIRPDGPYVLGISSGASLGVALVVLAGVGSSIGIAGAAWLGAAIVLVVIAAVGHRIKDIMVILILGMMFSSGIGAVVQILQYVANDESLKMFVIWTMGSLGDVTFNQLAVLIPSIIAGLLLAVITIKPLNLLLFGEEYAVTMGLNVRRSRGLLFLSTTLLAGTVTAFCGPIGFIGLAMPHVTRMLFRNRDHRVLVPGTVLSGAAVLLLCDLVSKMFTLPINAITALLGIPIVVWVVLRNKSVTA